MYYILKSVILAQGFELKGMLTKIKNFWADGSITESERKELIQLAQENAHIKNEVDILEKLEEMDKRVRAVEEKLANYEKAENPEEDTEQATYPEYVHGKWYYRGDIVLFEEKNYICTAPEGQVCTWTPKDYPAYWDEYAEPIVSG